MGLRVYDSDGQLRHPQNGGKTDVKFSSWFGRVHFKLDKQEREIVAYARMDTGHHQEQLYLRYTWEDSQYQREGQFKSELLNDFRAAIHTQLIEDREWKFAWREEVGTGDYIVNTLIRERRQFQMPSITDPKKREMMSGTDSRFNFLLQNSRGKTFVLDTINYQYATILVDSYFDVAPSIVVCTDANVPAARDATLAIEVTTSAPDVLHLPQVTKDRQQQVIEEIRDERRREVQDEISASLGTLKQFDDAEQIAKSLKQATAQANCEEVKILGPRQHEQYQSRLQRAENNLQRVSEERDRLESELRRTQSKLEKTRRRQHLSPSGLAHFTGKLVIGVSLVAAVIALLWFGGGMVFGPEIGEIEVNQQTSLAVNGTAEHANQVTVILHNDTSSGNLRMTKATKVDSNGRFRLSFTSVPSRRYQVKVVATGGPLDFGIWNTVNRTEVIAQQATPTATAINLSSSKPTQSGVGNATETPSPSPSASSTANSVSRGGQPRNVKLSFA